MTGTWVYHVTQTLLAGTRHITCTFASTWTGDMRMSACTDDGLSFVFSSSRCQTDSPGDIQRDGHTETRNHAEQRQAHRHAPQRPTYRRRRRQEAERERERESCGAKSRERVIKKKIENTRTRRICLRGKGPVDEHVALQWNGARSGRQLELHGPVRIVVRCSIVGAEEEVRVILSCASLVRPRSRMTRGRRQVEPWGGPSMGCLGETQG